jgi:hypothetical protein
MTNIPLLVLKDDSGRKFNNYIIPLAISALEKTFTLDFKSHKTLLTRLRKWSDPLYGQKVILSLSFDPKTCGMPIAHCPGNSFDLCKGCMYNPLTALLDSQFNGGSCVITDRDTVDMLLNVIELLAKANQYVIMRQSVAVDYEDSGG